MTNLSMALFQFAQAKIFNVSNEKVASSHAEIWATANGLLLFAESTIDLELPPEAKEKGLI